MARTPTWEASTGALVELLNSPRPILKVDAYTITLVAGTVLRWTSGDFELSFGGNTFVLGPGLVRGQVVWRTGISTDTLTVTVTDVAGTTINGVALPAFIASRGFDFAEFRLERVFCEIDGTPKGALPWFYGNVDDVEGDRHEARLTVASFTKLLEVAVPRDVFQSPCHNQVFDAFCKASGAAFTVTGAASGGTDSYRSTFAISGLGKPTGWGDLGYITMNSGPNAGVSRTCKKHTTTAIRVLQPWPFDVSPGDTFTLIAGCDRTKTTCDGKFDNLPNFRATPLVPVAETVL